LYLATFSHHHRFYAKRLTYISKRTKNVGEIKISKNPVF